MATVGANAAEDPPQTWQASVFLAGPMPRDPNVPSWRPEAIRLLTEAWQHDGVLAVFIPEARDRHDPPSGYVSQYWEERWMAVADVILFWVPRQMPNLPGLNTNIEFGRSEATGRIVLGLPPEAVSIHYLHRAAETHGAPVRDTLGGTVAATRDMIGMGADRSGPDRDVPLLIWRTPEFTKWRADAGGSLAAFRTLWAWSPAPAFTVQAWAALVDLRSDDSIDTRLVLVHPGSPEVISSSLPQPAIHRIWAPWSTRSPDEGHRDR